MKWEYKVVPYTEDGERTYVSWLNELGADGWELCESQGLVNVSHVFKRPLDSNKNILGGIPDGQPTSLETLQTVITDNATTANRERCAPPMWKTQRKCCPDCTHDKKPHDPCEGCGYPGAA